MAVRIRLKRMGRRNRPFFRISVMDAHVQRDGRAIEDIGYYDPMVRDKNQRVKINLERLEYWLSVGAKPTEKVATLIKKAKKAAQAAGETQTTAAEQQTQKSQQNDQAKVETEATASEAAGENEQPSE